MIPTNTPWRYPIAVCLVVLATIARRFLDPLLGMQFPFATLFFSILVAAWYGGFGPAVVATLCGAALALRFLLPPRDSFWLQNYEDLGGMALYLSIGFGLALLGGAMHAGRRRAEASALELRRSEAELADFFENASVGLHWVDAQGIIIRVNQAELNLLGYERHEYVGRPIANFHADAEVIDDILKRLSAGEVINNFPARLLCKDGTIKNVLIDSSVLWELGQFVHTRCFTRDITEQSRAERTLQENEQRLRLALEAGGMGTWEWNIQNNLVTWSPGLEAMHGLSPGTFAGTFQAFENDIHPDDREQVRGSIARTLEQSQDHHVEYRLVWSDGSVHWVEGRGKLYRDDAGQPQRMIGVCTDITARKAVEIRLRDSEERFRQLAEVFRFLADASAELAGIAEPQGLPERAARLAVPFFADCCLIDMLDTEGQLCRMAVAHRDPQRAALVPRARRALPADAVQQQGIWRILATGESELISEIPQDAAALTDESPGWIRQLGLQSSLVLPLVTRGKAIGVIMFFAGESGRRYERSDLSLAEDLAHRISIAIERARLYSELREADRRKDEFLATLAHELRNPLAPIRNALQILQLEESRPEAAAQARGMIDRQVRQMVRLVDDLLDVSRITRGKLELRKERAELATVIQTALETSQPLIDAAGHRLSVSLPAAPVWLDCDVTRLAQVFSNLLNNSAKYTERSGDIWLEAECRDSEVVVMVRDTGIGIRREMLPHVFEMFTQVDQSLERSQGGLGIGLTLVRRLVEMHGGSIEARSEGPGRGSEFSVQLPLAQVASETPQSPPDNAPPMESPTNHAPAKPVSAKKRRILVVDDNRDAATSLATMLRIMGNETQTAHDGEAAVATAEAFQPDLVLMDIGLPKLNGYDAAKQIRKHAWGASMQLIALTGWGQDEDKRRSMEAGFNLHLVKPVAPETLNKLLADTGSQA